MRLDGSRILVTGGAGFIGSELTRQLCQTGAHVTVLDNLRNGKRENLAGLSEDRFRLAPGDIRDSGLLATLLPGTDLIYHLACLGVRHSIHSPQENHEVNATATLGLLVAAQAAKVRRFVYVSTSEVYGTAQWTPMTEQHPTVPMTVYGASKLAGECYTRAFHRTYGYETVVVRPFNSFGPRCHHEGDSGEVIPRFMLRCLAGHPMVIFGDGSQTRDFTYVSDTARGILQAGVVDDAIGETFNLGQGSEITIQELARTVATVTGASNAAVIHESGRPGDVLRLYADSTNASRLLQFTPEVSLKTGLSNLLDWYSGLGVSPEALLEREQVHNWKADSR